MKNVKIFLTNFMLVLFASVLFTMNSCEKEPVEVGPTYCWECEGTGVNDGKLYFFCDLTAKEMTEMENIYKFTCNVSCSD